VAGDGVNGQWQVVRKVLARQSLRGSIAYNWLKEGVVVTLKVHSERLAQ
jgi:hypothetical protein